MFLTVFLMESELNHTDSQSWTKINEQTKIPEAQNTRGSRLMLLYRNKRGPTQGWQVENAALDMGQQSGKKTVRCTTVPVR